MTPTFIRLHIFAAIVANIACVPFNADVDYYEPLQNTAETENAPNMNNDQLLTTLETEMKILTINHDKRLVNAINKLILAVKDINRRVTTSAHSINYLANTCANCQNLTNSGNGKITLCAVHNPCPRELVCVDSSDGPGCTATPCPPELTWNGYQCTTRTSRRTCRDQPCFPGVVCYDTEQGHRCGACPPGYKGDGEKCERNHNICQTNPCTPGNVCKSIHTFPYYRCDCCPVGFTGNGTHCNDINECELANPCFANCTNLAPGFTCGPCPEGYEGTYGTILIGIESALQNKQKCTAIDKCKTGMHTCVPNSYCTSTSNSYVCGDCLPGYEGSQLDGCKLSEHWCANGIECDKNATCPKTGNGQLACRCKIGWAGNGLSCAPDLDLDGWPDSELNCSESHCRKDNCLNLPNSGQEDTDGDGIGDSCDPDADNDGKNNKDDNCPFASNADQKDRDSDRIGDLCDNCPSDYNADQLDTDGDGLGDACDDDIDNDGLPNTQDNCPIVANPDQRDTDEDRIGNACDNCPNMANSNQLDENANNIGDVCESGVDTDGDGVPDNLDNCPTIPNADQLSSDGDGLGDACDLDKDNDGIPDTSDNCVLVFNPDQRDTDGDGQGDACQGDADGDGVKDLEDNCPLNSQIHTTNFTKYQTVAIDGAQDGNETPVWVILNKGAEILQTKNSFATMALAGDRFNGVDYEGTFYVGDTWDDDYIGFVFGYQNIRKFYVVMWKKQDQPFGGKSPSIAKTGLQIKLVDSTKGTKNDISQALWHTGNTTDQVKLLYHDPQRLPWERFVSYRWKLVHRPSIGLIHVEIHTGGKKVIDSGNIYDCTLRGGRLGVFCLSQDKVTWSDLKYKCKEDIPKQW